MVTWPPRDSRSTPERARTRRRIEPQPGHHRSPALLIADSWEPLCGINRDACRGQREPGAEHATAPFNFQSWKSIAGRFQVLKP